MVDYVLCVISAILLTSFASIILPEGKLGKYVKSIFSMLIIVVMITPIFNLSFNFNDKIEEESITVFEDEKYLDYINNEKSKKLCENLNSLIKSFGYNCSVEILTYDTINEFRVKKIIINLIDFVLNDTKEHIVLSNEIKQAVINYLGYNAEVEIKSEILWKNKKQ